MKPLIQVNGLKKTYDGQKYALNGIDVTIYEGEFVVIVGPSGSGKSTFIRCLNQMIDASEGKLSFMGQDVSHLKNRQLRAYRQQIGMVFQHHNLVGRTNVIKNVMHGCLGRMGFIKSFLGLYKEKDKAEAYDLLNEVGLVDQMFQRVDQLSGGQMQRVGICRAIMQQPKLILADEPIASLDPLASKKVMDYLFKLTKQRQLTCIVNLHQVNFAKKYATRIIGIRQGQVVFDGKPEALTGDMIAYLYEGKEAQSQTHNNIQLEGQLDYGNV